MRRGRLAAVVGALLAAGASAAEIRFDEGWRELRFSPFSSNDFLTRGDTLTVRSDGTVSLFWTRLPESLAGARTASWRWRVTDSPPATDLTRKGGDDRALALYFVFLPPEALARLRGVGLPALLDAEAARVLTYVVGGETGPVPELLPNPWLGPRGRTIRLRGAAAGDWTETVDLAADHRRAFGAPPGRLVGVAVSADSDDTKSRARGEVSALTLH